MVRSNAVRLNRTSPDVPPSKAVYDMEFQEGGVAGWELVQRVYIPCALRHWFDEAQRHPRADFAFQLEELAEGSRARTLPGRPWALVTGVKFGKHFDSHVPKELVRERQLCGGALFESSVGLVLAALFNPLLVPAPSIALVLAWHWRRALPRKPWAHQQHSFD